MSDKIKKSIKIIKSNDNIKNNDKIKIIKRENKSDNSIMTENVDNHHKHHHSHHHKHNKDKERNKNEEGDKKKIVVLDQYNIDEDMKEDYMWNILKNKNINNKITEDTNIDLYIEKYQYKLEFLNKLIENTTNKINKEILKNKIKIVNENISYCKTKLGNKNIETMKSNRKNIDKIIKPLSRDVFNSKIDLTGSDNKTPDPTTSLFVGSKDFYKNSVYKEIPKTIKKIDFKTFGFKSAPKL